MVLYSDSHTLYVAVRQLLTEVRNNTKVCYAWAVYR
jgi:hypothetical protein